MYTLLYAARLRALLNAHSCDARTFDAHGATIAERNFGVECGAPVRVRGMRDRIRHFRQHGRDKKFCASWSGKARGSSEQRHAPVARHPRDTILAPRASRTSDRTWIRSHGTSCVSRNLSTDRCLGALNECLRGGILFSHGIAHEHRGEILLSRPRGKRDSFSDLVVHDGVGTRRVEFDARDSFSMDALRNPDLAQKFFRAHVWAN